MFIRVNILVLIDEEYKYDSGLPSLDELNAMRADYKFDGPAFSTGSFEEVGEGICVSLLDFFDINPCSRLPNTSYKNIRVFKAAFRNLSVCLEPETCSGNVNSQNYAIPAGFFHSFGKQKSRREHRKFEPISRKEHKGTKSELDEKLTICM